MSTDAEQRPAAAVAPGVAHGSVSVSPFRYDGPFVTDRLPEITAQVEAWTSLGFFGDTSVDLHRKRTSAIDYANPATRRLLHEVPGADA